MFLSAYTYPSLNGIAAHPVNAIANVKIGAIIKSEAFAAIGTIVSFSNNFLPSAKGVNSP